MTLQDWGAVAAIAGVVITPLVSGLFHFRDRRIRAARIIAADLKNLQGLFFRLSYELTELRPTSAGLVALSCDLEAALERCPQVVATRFDLGLSDLEKGIEKYYSAFNQYTRALFKRLEPHLLEEGRWPPRADGGEVWCAGYVRSIENQLAPDAQHLVNTLEPLTRWLGTQGWRLNGSDPKVLDGMFPHRLQRKFKRERAVFAKPEVDPVSKHD